MPTKPTKEEAEALVQFATQAQQRALIAYVSADCNTVHAAAALKLSRSSLRDAFDGARRRAAARGYAPAHGWNPPTERTEIANVTPPGFELEKVTDNVGPDGERLQAWNKLRQERGLPEAPPPDFLMTRFSQATAGGREVMTWKSFEPSAVDKYLALEKAIRDSVADFVRPLAPVEAPQYTDRDTMALYPIGDPHIGMLAHAEETGEDFDLKIAERDLCGAMDRLTASMPRSSIGVLIPLGDNFHADDDLQRTPAHHHKLDVDSRAHKVAKAGVNIFRYMIDRGLTIHDQMHVRVVSGNHDPVTSMWLRLCLEGWYSHEPRVKVFTDPSPIQVWEFGQNMNAVAHGHGVKAADMAGVMAARYREIWGRTRFHYGMQGHKHRREMIEKGGALIEVFQTLAGKDSFASMYGYDSGQSLVGLVQHALFGEISRITCDVTWARAMAMAEAA